MVLAFSGARKSRSAFNHRKLLSHWITTKYLTQCCVGVVLSIQADELLKMLEYCCEDEVHHKEEARERAAVDPPSDNRAAFDRAWYVVYLE